MNKQNHSEQGSSSLMVILIVFTLILFGVFAMMSSYTEYKLSLKYANWTKDYYQLDQMAVKKLASLDLVKNNGKTFEETLQLSDDHPQKLHIKYKVVNNALVILSWQEVQNGFDITETESLWDGGN